MIPLDRQRVRGAERRGSPRSTSRFFGVIRPVLRRAEATRRFAELWPIFRVSKLRERGIDYWNGQYGSRDEMIHTYLDAGAREFAPQCLFDHEELPLDWGHTLAALYRVRCNLFHGEKAGSSENDQVVVSAAYQTLRAFLDESRLLG